MKRDLEIQKNVMDELSWTPLLNSNEIGVAVKNGIVTLSGIVDSYPKKIKAERVAQKVAGVRGIALNIEVRLKETDKRDDSEIAQSVLYELEWHCTLDPQKIKIHVEAGIVILEGMVNWDFQRKSAAKTIWNIKGVTGIRNNIKLADAPPPSNLHEKINSALDRHAKIDAKRIKVNVEGHKITLSGSVSSFADKLDAEKAMWSSPGVTAIDNQLECADDML
jgi:osmotically-inducible protein OsmY